MLPNFRFIIATQDWDLRTHIHSKVIGTPVLYLNHSAPTLEKPTEKCELAAQKAST